MNARLRTSDAKKLEQALTICAKEPIHLPNSIQPHGFLVVLNEDLLIERISDNTQLFLPQFSPEKLGKRITDCWDEESVNTITYIAEQSNAQCNLQSTTLTMYGQKFDSTLYRVNNNIVIECEPVVSETEHLLLTAMCNQLDYFIDRLQQTHTIAEQCQITVEELHKLTGFARTKIYQFDEDWHGHVIAESKDNHMKSYLNHHFPAGDIPEQARALYVRSPLRLIADVNYNPVNILSSTKNPSPLDMSLSVLRSVSPVHLQYLRNMRVAASMSISILHENKLWGLICCHHHKPKYLPYSIRKIAQLMGEMLALQISVLTSSQELAYREQVQQNISSLTSKLRNQVHTKKIEHTLPELMQAVAATGIALHLNHKTFVWGKTPAKEIIAHLVNWLINYYPRALFSTHNLSAEITINNTTRAIASGLLATPVGKNLDDIILWFRPEIIQTIKWAGNPQQTKNLDASGNFLTPRKSFDLWEQTVRGTAAPWKQVELEAARQLADMINACQIDQKLKESFKEIETLSYIISHDFRAPLLNLHGFTQELQQALNKLPEIMPNPPPEVQTIIANDMTTTTKFINNAVNKLDIMTSAMLELSRTGRRELRFTPVDTKALTEQCIQTLQHQINTQGITVSIKDLPTVIADYVSLQQIFSNILDNAVKYLVPTRCGIIEICAKQTPAETIFIIKDNGRGIAQKDIHKVFEIFHRIGNNDVPGEGMGMAYVKTLVERHGGRLWCKSKVEKETRFYFSIARNLLEHNSNNLEKKC
ncbi:MAG: ATP-binding protein [Gammaproteobacteria bacterium]